MRIAVTAVDAMSTRTVDVLLDLSPETTIGQLEAALGPLLPGALGGTWLGEHELDAATSVTTAGLHAGACLSLGGPLRTPKAPAARAELRVVSGPEAGAIYLLPDGDSTAGTAAAISLPGPGVAPRQLLLQSGPNGVVATNVDAVQPVRRMGTPLAGAVPISPDDVLEVGRHLVSVVPVTSEVPGLLAPGPDLTRQIQRPDRQRPAAVRATVELPAPPIEPSSPRLDLRLVAVPVLPALLLAAVSGPAWLWLLLLAPVLVVGLHQRQKQRAHLAWDREEHQHEQQRIATSAEIRRLAAEETAARRWADPDAAAVLRIASGHDTRLWERRPGDEDFLRLRFGTGRATARSCEVLAPAGVTPPPPSTLHDVPLCVDLLEVGTLALVGPADLTEPMARWLVGQAAVLHSPQDLSVWLLTDPFGTSTERHWSWLRWLPHSTRLRPDGADDGGLLIGNTEASLELRIAELRELVAQRLAMAEDPRSAPAIAPPVQLVVVDVAVAGRPGIADLLRDGPRVGVHLICLLQKQDELPQRCGAELLFEGSGRVALRRGKTAEVPEARAELVRVAWAEKVARALAPVRLVGAAAAVPPLPSLVTATEALQLSTSPAWDGTEVRLGTAVEGPFAIDLVRDGPHVVIAGAAGSGRTQLLRTSACSLAATHRPDALSLVLFAEGDVFADLAGLPHTAAVLSWSDGAEVSRALTSLVAEVARREGAGTSSPALVLVIDEVEKLLDALPGAAAAIDEVVRRGGRVGIHLVLGTGRPSAVLSARLRETAGVRIALRVERSDTSLDVLESPAAATIARGTPGRAYARIRQGPLVGFQAALLDGRQPAPEHASGVAVEQLTWPRLGDRSAPSAAVQPPVDVVADLVALLTSTAHQTGAVPASPPWLPPLPTAVALEALRETATSGLGRVLFGLADLPAELSQRPATFDLERGGHLLVAGDTRSGRSTFLTTLAASLAAAVTPSEAHLYALDCGGGALLPLSQLPHCGAVVIHHEADRADRLLARLALEISRRQQQLAGRGFSDLAAQREGSADPLPYLVLLLDGWEGFVEVLGPIEGGRLRTALLDLVRDGAPAGLRVIVSGGGSLLGDELAELIPDRYVLRLEERELYRTAGLDPTLLPSAIGAGRAFRVADATAVQVARLSDDTSAGAQSAAIEELAATLPAARGRRPFRVDLLPEVITATEAHELGVAGVGAAFAVGGDELRVQTVNLAACGPGFTIAGPAGCGRSTALVVLAQALLEQGTRLCLLTPRESPLAELAELPGVLSSDVPGLRRVLGGTIAPLAVLIDDAELLEDDELDELLQQALHDGRRTDRSVVVAGTTEQLAAQAHGFAFYGRRSRSGLLLCPQPEDGDLLGVRLPASSVKQGPTGRGVLVRSGQTLLVQVPLPS